MALPWAIHWFSEYTSHKGTSTDAIDADKMKEKEEEEGQYKDQNKEKEEKKGNGNDNGNDNDNGNGNGKGNEIKAYRAKEEAAEIIEKLREELTRDEYEQFDDYLEMCIEFGYVD